ELTTYADLIYQTKRLNTLETHFTVIDSENHKVWEGCCMSDLKNLSFTMLLEKIRYPPAKRHWPPEPR
ncbi:unnamed protein product, partial [Symbiodinium sp. CCMP2456]